MWVKKMPKKEIDLQDVNVYEEITKLNNELLNSKRIIEKQNAELQNYNKLLKKMSIEDSLTGCYNRRQFYEYFRESIMSSQKDTLYTLIMIDFNHFKTINDQFGHDAGDRLLVMFVQIASNILSVKGDVFRLGGDEFILLIKNDQNFALNVMEEINQRFLKHSTIASLAFGIVEFREHEINHEFDLTNLVRKADDLMYQHKKSFYEKTK